MMAKTKTEPMVEHRVTVVVRYPLTGVVPVITDTVASLINGELGDDVAVDVVETRARTVRVPVSENGAGR